MQNKLKEYEYNAVSLLRNSDEGILSTISNLHEGYPFGSFITFITDHSRTIYFYISDLAQHTKNIDKEPKACLTLSRKNKKKDKQNSERLTLIGDVNIVSTEKLDYCKKRFFKHFPKSKAYSEFHDFRFYQMTINQVRWIGGFGKIAWLKSLAWQNKEIDWVFHEKNIVDHMNKDHQKNISSALSFQYNIQDKNARILFLTIDGYYLESNNIIYFIQLYEPVYTRKEYRKALVDLATQYRSHEL